MCVQKREEMQNDFIDLVDDWFIKDQIETGAQQPTRAHLLRELESVTMLTIPDHATVFNRR